jgi:transcriptional regulator with XRE-family HTH domain
MPKPHDAKLQEDTLSKDAIEAMQLLFGTNLRQARIKAGLTQQAVEAQTTIKQAYISQIEGGKQNLTLETMMILAHAVDENVLALLQQPTSTTKLK